MAVPKNLVWEQSTSTGTGNKTLARYGGFARVSEAFSTGDAGSANPILFFANKDATSAEWEVVQGYMSDANTFVPVTRLDSSNGGSAVTFTTGLKFVTNDVPAAYQVYLDSSAASPLTNDGAALGTATKSWSDVFLASGGVLNWNNGDVTATHASNALAFAGASSGYSFDAVVKPSTDDGAALGTTALKWSDLFLAAGGIIDLGNGAAKLQESSGNLLFTGGHVYNNVANPPSSNVAGWSCLSGGAMYASVDGGPAANYNRKTSDGAVVNITQDGTVEGQITVSGTTVTYGAFCGAHWSQLHGGGILDIPRGTIVETLDQMCSWPGEENDQLARFKISDTPGSPRVYGVFISWDADDQDSNDANIASLGAYLVRIAAGVTVQRGDLIESNGDGCGRVQADDIVRARTVGKVTSSAVIETYSDGSYLVPCVLYCG